MKTNVFRRDYSLDLLRFIAIVILVAYHSFAMYTDNWSNPKGMQEISMYNMVGRLLSRVSFQSFTFIAGYIFMMQIQKNRWSFGQLFIKKAERLLIPAVVFTFCYIVLFGCLAEVDFSVFITGAGHMWYLPMLFCSFLVGFFILRSGNKWMIVFLMAFIIVDAVLGYSINLPYGMQVFVNMVKCMPFFIAGALCRKYKELIVSVLPPPYVYMQLKKTTRYSFKKVC